MNKIIKKLGVLFVMAGIVANATAGNIKMLATETTNEETEIKNEQNENENTDDVFDIADASEAEAEQTENEEEVIEWENMNPEETKDEQALAVDDTDNDGSVTEAKTIKEIFPDAKFAEEMVKELRKKSVDDTVDSAELEKVEFLRIVNANITDISGVEHLINLEALDMSENQISNIDPLSYLVNLTRLNMSSNQISKLDALAGLVKLDNLRFSYNLVNNVEILSNLVNLKDLEIRNNQITEIGALKNLTTLEKLALSNNQITEIDALASLVNLDSLYINNNQISNIDALSNLVNLRSLWIGYNKINNLEPLKALEHQDLSVLSFLQETEETVEVRNNATVENRVKDVDGNLITPQRISHGGVYSAPYIVWENISSDAGQRTYTWEQEVVLGGKVTHFSGTHTVKLEHVAPRNVKYMANGEEHDSGEVYPGDKLSAPVAPEKFGYTFIGWFDEAGNLWDFATSVMPDGDLTLRAKFVDNFTSGVWYVRANGISAYEKDVKDLTAEKLSEFLIENGNVQVLDNEGELVYNAETAKFSVTNIADLKDLSADNTYDVTFHFEEAITAQDDVDNTSFSVKLTVLADPVDPTEPTDPEEPTDPVEPAEPEQPGEPTEPEQPVDEETTTPGTPITPGNTTGATNTVMHKANTKNTATLAKAGGYTFEQLLFGSLLAIASGIVLFVKKRQGKTTENNQ